MDTIPEDAVQEILKKLPTKSLLRFKCVSKRWCSMIEDPVFVEAFRVRSRNRSACLLVRKNRHEKISNRGKRKANDFFLVDLKGNSVPLPVPSYLEILTFLHEDDHGSFTKKQPILRFVEGLACINNIIWNPTTRKIMDLPPRKLNNVHVRKVNEDTNIVAGSYSWFVSAEYFLGFYYSTKEYKVLSISRTRSKINYGISGYNNAWDTIESQVYAEVLTLGTNSWRNTNFSLPEELESDFSVVTHCSINGIIYLVIHQYPHDYVSGQRYYLLTFDLSNEKFQLLSVPKDFDYPDHACEAGERFALIELLSRKIWILQDLESGKWTEEDFLWPQDWYRNPSYCRFTKCIIEPIGSCPSGDILFKRRKLYSRRCGCGEQDDDDDSRHGGQDDKDDSQPVTCVCYDMKQKSARIIPELNGVIDFNTEYDADDICIMQGESIHPLKYS